MFIFVSSPFIFRASREARVLSMLMPVVPKSCTSSDGLFTQLLETEVVMEVSQLSEIQVVMEVSQLLETQFVMEVSRLSRGDARV